MAMGWADNLCRPGTGLRPVHYPHLQQHSPKVVTWFEAVSENYMESRGNPRKMLERIRSTFPVALHGVGMNLGSGTQVNEVYLKNLKTLVDEIEPFVYSDHLCWSAAGGKHSHDLLPFPLTPASLTKLSANIAKVQDFMGRPMAIENVSHYLTFKANEYSESQFMAELVRRTGCKILLDINNVYVSSQNLNFDPYVFLDTIPVESVAQIHLAGFTDLGDLLFDTHSKPVCDEVWQMFAHFIAKAPSTPFMIEWDEDIPDFARLEAEVSKACAIWAERHADMTKVLHGSSAIPNGIHRQHSTRGHTELHV